MHIKFGHITRLMKWMLIFVVSLILVCNLVVELNSQGKTIDSVYDLSPKKVGLVLGTSRYVKGGDRNLFYANRIQAAVELFNHRKIQFILVSGDNRKEEYNEPRMMYQDLVKAGIPKERIIMDFAGFRTLDSVVRCKEIFSEEDIVIISQEFHNKRALFIAHWKKMNAVGYNAGEVGTLYGLKTSIREAFARVKVVMDMLTNKQPHFLGEKIEIK